MISNSTSVCLGMTFQFIRNIAWTCPPTSDKNWREYETSTITTMKKIKILHRASQSLQAYGHWIVKKSTRLSWRWRRTWAFYCLHLRKQTKRLKKRQTVEGTNVLCTFYANSGGCWRLQSYPDGRNPQNITYTVNKCWCMYELHQKRTAV